MQHFVPGCHTPRVPTGNRKETWVAIFAELRNETRTGTQTTCNTTVWNKRSTEQQCDANPTYTADTPKCQSNQSNHDICRPGPPCRGNSLVPAITGALASQEVSRRIRHPQVFFPSIGFRNFAAVHGNHTTPLQSMPKYAYHTHTHTDRSEVRNQVIML